MSCCGLEVGAAFFPGKPIRLAIYERWFNGISLGLMEISEDLMRINMIQIDLMESPAV
jgi:hypothetical protein